MILKTTLCRDDNWYLAWPDIVQAADGRLLCVFTQCTHHGDRTASRLCLCQSHDQGRTWSPRQYLTEACPAHDYWNCARLSRLPDGTLALVCDRIQGRESENRARVYLWRSHDNGESWQGPFPTGAEGIVPDKLLAHNGRWLLAAHRLNTVTGKLAQYLWYSEDEGARWAGPATVADDPSLNLCEASLLPLPDGTLAAFMRENSGQGWDCFKALSSDGGLTWQGPYPVPLPGCHRPVAGRLQSGRVMITYRFMQGGRGWLGSWTQNFFAALTDEESVRAERRQDQAVRILPVDFDRSPVSDLGYSGWVELPDGEIVCVNYIVDDAPKGQIRCYRFREEDFLLPGAQG